jgi:hypothetical protein
VIGRSGRAEHVRVNNQPCAAQRPQQHFGVVGPYTDPDRRAKQASLGPGAVEEIQQTRAARIAQLEHHRPTGIRPQLQPVRITPQAA